MSNNLPNGWKECKLGKVVYLNQRSIDSTYEYQNIVYLDTGSITRGRITDIKEYKLSEAPSRAKKPVKHNDIVYSTVRPIQRHYGIINNPPDNMLVSTGFAVIEAIESLADPFFIYYFLTLDEIVEVLDIIAEASTSAYPSFRPSDLENINILLPPLPEQRAIASVLSSLDDKIDLLHRENKSLEAMAETLFRQWFIEEAKDEWEEVPLSEVTKIAIGRTPPRKESHWFSTDPKNVKWVSIKDLGQSEVFVFDTSEYLTQEAVENFNIPIIPADTVLLSFKMTVGRVGITTEPMVSNEAIAHFKFDDNTPFSKEYLYIFLKTFKYESLGSTSSIVTAINSSMIKDIEIIIPDDITMNVFRTYTEPLFSKIKSNIYQIRTLEKLRDTLLPKLMSGEVRVKYEKEEVTSCHA
jgi:type I restriction enzyme S subunit